MLTLVEKGSGILDSSPLEIVLGCVISSHSMLYFFIFSLLLDVHCLCEEHVDEFPVLKSGE